MSHSQQQGRVELPLNLPKRRSSDALPIDIERDILIVSDSSTAALASAIAQNFEHTPVKPLVHFRPKHFALSIAIASPPLVKFKPRELMLRRLMVNGPLKANPPGQPWYTFKNVAAAGASVETPATINIFGFIGRDPETGDGKGYEEFANEFSQIPKNQKIDLQVHSPGGSVWDALLMYNLIKGRSADVTAQVLGLAASAASFLLMAAGKVIMPRHSRLMIHNAHGAAGGDAEAHEYVANLLKNETRNIARMYAEKTKKSLDDILAMMKATTWMNGDEARAMGFCDVVTDGAVLNCASFDLTCFRNVPAALAGTPAPQPTQTNMKSLIIALLRKHGITVNDDATDAQLGTLLAQLQTKIANVTAHAADLRDAAGYVAYLNALNPTPTPTPAPAPQNQPPSPAPAPTPVPANVVDVTALLQNMNAIQARLETERVGRISTELDQLILNNQLTVAERPAALVRATKDDTYLNDLRARPAVMPGPVPVNVVIDRIGEDPKNIEKGILAHWGQPMSDAYIAPKAVKERALIRAQIIAKNYDRIMPVILNTNTVSADLKRNVILQQMARAFATRILPLTHFCHSLGAIKLEGTNKVVVPYFSLDTTASSDFSAATGYDTFGNTNAEDKEVTINKRKYQGLRWASEEFRRQPFMNIAMGALLKTEQLAKDVVNDVLTVITQTNFGASVKSEPAGSFDSNDVIDLKGIADGLDWPDAGRSLTLDTAFDINLLKDPDIKRTYAWGDNKPIREGRILELSGFAYTANAHIPANGESLAGWIAWMSAILFAQSFVEPTEEVRHQLTRYEAVIEPTSGATFEFRSFGDATLDRSSQTIESNYGFDLGELAALRRITSQ